MAKIPVLDALRIIPRDADFLDRRSGNRGEIYIDGAVGTLRLYDGSTGGVNLLRDDLSNISTAALDKNIDLGTGTITASQFIGAGIGAVLGDTPPVAPVAQSGTLWFNTSTGKLYIYYNDGNSLQWVQPMTPSVGGGAGGGGTSNLDGLTDVTITTPTAGQVLKYNGSSWTNDVDATSGGGGGSGGTVTSVSVTSANGFAGTVATASSTPVITITTSITGLLKGGSSAISAAVAGTDYQAPITLTTIGSSGAATFTSGTLNIPQYTGGATSLFTGLSDVTTAGLSVDQFYLPAITRLNVTNNGASSYSFDQYAGTNPTIYAINATTISFNLTGISGHPFLIQDNTGTNYNTGLVHVSTSGTVSTGSSAQGKTSGTLYWKIPDAISGNYRYQCSLHAGMIGTIVVKNFVVL
jgi:plastocyanin